MDGIVRVLGHAGANRRWRHRTKDSTPCFKWGIRTARRLQQPFVIRQTTGVDRVPRLTDLRSLRARRGRHAGVPRV